MPLASKDGKLIIKDGKLCSSCCDDDTSGACCFLNETGEYACEVTTKSTCQSRGGKWHEGQECKSDDNPDGIDCSDPDNQPEPGPDPDPPTGACCYPDGDIPAHCHDDKTQAECESEGGTWHEGKVCNEDGECPPVDPPPPTGKCCVYTGQQFSQGCGDTREECLSDAQREVASVENGYFDENDITFDPDPDADCPYSVAVYEYIPEADTPVCWDEDEDGNPVTKDFCDALKTPDVFKAEFTEGEDCGGGNSGLGTCPPATRSNPLP